MNLKKFFFLFVSLLAIQSIYSQVDIGKKFIPYVLPWDDMPIDLSFVYADEKPAGKHGFMRIPDSNELTFEDGTKIRFWGTNFNGAQIFPPHEQSEKVARRLAKVGINIVRFHQMDSEWATPNIFSFTRGVNKENTQSLDSISMDRLDYLIYCLKREGIYVYMDMLTYRRFKSGDGVREAHLLADAAKPYSVFDRRMIDLQKQFNRDLWTHYNPYTKLAYKDEPAIVFTEVTNECDLWSQNVVVEPYRSELEARYREWAAIRKIKVGKDKISFDKENIDIQQFFIDVTTAYYHEIVEDLRSIGVKIPISGTNWTRNAAHLTAQNACDFIDTHAYAYWPWRDWKGNFSNESVTGTVNNMLNEISFYKLPNKPLFISEWDNPYPNEWRAECPLLLSAVGAFQDWSGFAIHTYRYGLDENVDMIGKPVTGNAINGISYRGGVFDTFNDPAKFGLFYHAALILRRGDVKPAEKTVNIQISDIRQSKGEASNLTPELHRVETLLPGMKPSPKAIITEPEKRFPELKPSEVLSDTKEMYRNLNKRFGWIDSERTKAVYGFVGEQGEIALNDMTVTAINDFATIAVSSLTNEPINRSSNMLLTAVGRAENTDVLYDAEHTQQLDPGYGPMQIEIIEAAIKIRTTKPHLRVMSINPQGMITGYMKSEYKDGVLYFSIGKEFQSMYYLIQEM